MTQLCHINDIPNDSSKSFTIGKHSLFAVKKEDEIYIYINQCPHLGVELNWQEDQFLDMDNALIQCATHGALFVIENGECVSGPCIGKMLQPIAFTVKNDHINISITTDS